MFDRGCESPILGMPPTAGTRCRFGSGKLRVVVAMKKPSPRQNTQRSRKPRIAVRLDEQTLLPSVVSAFVPGTNGSVAGQFAKSDLRYWKQQLIHRAHGDSARPRPFRELSARIEHAGGSCFFPLDTAAAQTAAVRARQIYRTVLTQGWPGAFRRYPREVTLALFWAENPMTLTYATLYTATDALRDAGPPPLRPIHRGVKVSVACSSIARTMPFSSNA